MKILHLARLYEPHVGGVEQHLIEINKIFIKKNFEITILTTKHDSTLPDQEFIEGVFVQRLNLASVNDKNFFSKLRFKLKIWFQILKKINLFLIADVIQVHDVTWWILPIYPLIWQKFYITFHGYEGDALPNIKQIFWHRLGANLAKANMCIGGFHQKWYGVRPNIISFGAVGEIITEKKIKNKNEIKIVFIGRLAEDNGILKYLEAIKICHDNKLDVKLDIFGDGPLCKHAKKYAQDNHLDVSFLGFDKSARNKIGNYDFALVSRYLAILEALLVGVPVIAQYNNKLQEDYLQISPFAGWIEIKKTAVEIAEYLLHGETSEKNLVLAQKWAQRQSWQKLANDYLKLWTMKL